MIKSFKHKGLERFYKTGNPSGIRADQVMRVTMALDALDVAITLDELRLPKFRLHALKGKKPVRHSIRISGNYRMTFEWKGGFAFKIDLEDYH